MEAFVRHVAKQSHSDVTDVTQLLILTALQSQPQDKINQTVLGVVRVSSSSQSSVQSWAVQRCANCDMQCWADDSEHR